MSAIERTIKTNSKYIQNCSSKINSIYDCGSKQHNGIFFDRSIFTKTSIDMIVDDLNKMYSIKITLNKPKFSLVHVNNYFPKEKWHRYASISWENGP
mgnify:CR=1 FL=1